jgi:hypothetical protein
LLRRQRAPVPITIAILEAFVLRQGRIELGLQEGEEEVEEIDAQAVGDDVPALREDDA